MIDVNHEQVFLEFVKGHDILNHVTYNDKKIKNQKIIGLMVDGIAGEDNEKFIPFVKPLLEQSDSVVIDPNYDELYNSFLKIDHNLDSVDYIKNLVEATQTQNDVLNLLLNVIITPLIDSNINAEKVYFRVKPYWNTEWCDQVIEVN